ncbi:MAG: hypothetical protein JO044_07920 [Mycobacteriaceae bacterium]|nr:hypothetical protein [Mycobacteriaceae bacterium]MBV9639285.1 hypothetical protein [Mycobacteriaceae bacterium]
MGAERRPGGRRLIVVGTGAAAAGAVALVAVLHLTSPRHDDCAVATDVISTWRSMTAAVDQMLDGGGDQRLAAAVAESATADQLRSQAGGIASPHLRADVFGLADALEAIARSQRVAITSRQDAAADPLYIKASHDAAGAAAALRMACP